jgi:hypothetical protein
MQAARMEPLRGFGENYLIDTLVHASLLSKPAAALHNTSK